MKFKLRESRMSKAELQDALDYYTLNSFAFDGIEDYVETDFPFASAKDKQTVINYLRGDSDTSNLNEGLTPEEKSDMEKYADNISEFVKAGHAGPARTECNKLIAVLDKIIKDQTYNESITHKSVKESTSDDPIVDFNRQYEGEAVTDSKELTFKDGKELIQVVKATKDSDYENEWKEGDFVLLCAYAACKFSNKSSAMAVFDALVEADKSELLKDKDFLDIFDKFNDNNLTTKEQALEVIKGL